MQINTLQAGQKQLISSHVVVHVYRDNNSGQHALHAGQDFAVNEVICAFAADQVLTAANYLTLQTGQQQHITLQPAFLQYTNHSCDPNVFFDTEQGCFTAIKKISKGDELRFFYPSTEWEMAAPFICNCGAEDCLQLVNGAALLSSATLSRYRVTAFIRQMAAKKFASQ